MARESKALTTNCLIDILTLTNEYDVVAQNMGMLGVLWKINLAVGLEDSLIPNYQILKQEIFTDLVGESIGR